MANSYLQLDRPILSRQHQALGWLCKDASMLVNYALFDFYRTTLVSASALSRDSFKLQIFRITTQFIEQVPLNYRRFVPFMTEIIHANLLSTLFDTDWLLEFGNASNSYLIRAFPRVFVNSTCICAVSSMCHQLMRIGSPEIIIPGLIIGCTTVDGLRLSTLECFFSSSCIATILSYLDYYLEMDGSTPVNFIPPTMSSLVIKPLNASLISKFLPTTRISAIIDELFIEKWTNTSSFEDYFTACAPRYCRYEYTKRSDLLYLLTSFLGVYGGLTVGLRFVVFQGVLLFEKLKHRIFAAHRLSQSPMVVTAFENNSK